jgi:hypothetical protein
METATRNICLQSSNSSVEQLANGETGSTCLYYGKNSVEQLSSVGSNT